MKVTVLDRTTGREKTMCQAARGDYMAEWNGEKTFEEVMDVVNYDDRDLDRAKEKNNYPELSDETEAKLISFIEKQLSRGHYGPMEQSSITFTVKNVSRSLMAQITRHRHLTFDVQSQRYVDFSDTEAITPESLLNPDHFSREDGMLDITEEEQTELREKYETITTEQFEYYEELVDAGIPKEDARFVLPIGTPVNMTFSGNARTMMHVLNLRQKATSQWEIRELSNMVAEHLETWMPYTFEWWEENGPVKNSP